MRTHEEFGFSFYVLGGVMFLSRSSESFVRFATLF